MRKYAFCARFAFLVALAALPAVVTAPPVQASEIKYIVNSIPVTSGDIKHRAAFLRLQHRKGDATQEMIDQTLKLAEAKRLGIRISDQQVNEAYARFAANNKMQLKQLDGVMAQSGVTQAHFKDFIRAQMAWNQALGARARAEQGGGNDTGLMDTQQAVRRMLEQGGNKPSATEYMLQQVIFVVPADERKAILGKRKRAAEAMRARFNGCNTTREFAKGLIDVTVRDLGRVLAPKLPSDWAEQIKKTKTGSATPVHVTDRGVEFIGVCSAREVSDDRVAALVFEAEGAKGGDDALAKKYLGELKKDARIVKR